MVELFANSRYSDQMPHPATSDLGMHCLPFTCLGVSSLQWVNVSKYLNTLYIVISLDSSKKKKTKDIAKMRPKVVTFTNDLLPLPRCYAREMKSMS